MSSFFHFACSLFSFHIMFYARECAYLYCTKRTRMDFQVFHSAWGTYNNPLELSSFLLDFIFYISLDDFNIKTRNLRIYLRTHLPNVLCELLMKLVWWRTRKCTVCINSFAFIWIQAKDFIEICIVHFLLSRHKGI